MSYIDEIIQEVQSMTPDYGFNVCLFNEFGETKLSLLGHFDTFGEAQEFGNQFENDTVYIYGDDNAREVGMSEKKNHNIDKYLDMAEKDYEEGTGKPNDEYEKTNYGEEVMDPEEQKAYNYLDRSESPETAEDLERWAINAGVKPETMIHVYDTYFSGESVDDLQRRKKQLEDELQYTDAYNTSQRIKSELDTINYQLEKQGQFTGVRYTIRGSDNRVIIKSDDLNEAKMIAKNHSHHGAYIVDEKTSERIQVWEAIATESLDELYLRFWNNGNTFDMSSVSKEEWIKFAKNNGIDENKAKGFWKSKGNEAFTKYSLLTDVGQDLNTMDQQNNSEMDDIDESYKSVYNFAEEQIGQGIKGHQPWMRQMKYGGEQNRMCDVCNAYTDHSDGKCVVCGNSELSIEVRKSYNTKAFEANIHKYDPNDPDYQYLLDYPNDGAVDKEDQAVPRETMNEVMSMPQTGKTCYTCGYYDEDGIGNHTCS